MPKNITFRGNLYVLKSIDKEDHKKDCKPNEYYDCKNSRVSKTKCKAGITKKYKNNGKYSYYLKSKNK